MTLVEAVRAYGFGARVRLVEPTQAMTDSGADVLMLKDYYYECGSWWVAVDGGPTYGAKLLGDRECVFVRKP